MKLERLLKRQGMQPRQRRKRIPQGVRLTTEWAAFYDNDTGEIDERADKGGADWESLCVGWCIAKGTTVEEAYAFYAEMIHGGRF